MNPDFLTNRNYEPTTAKGKVIEAINHPHPADDFHLVHLNELDDFGTFLLTESIRFLVNCFKFQKHYDFNYEGYYNSVLSKFHDLGYLLFKKDVSPYKMYKNKKYAFKINYKLNDENIQLVYYSLKNMRIDYGRYRTDKITQLYPKQSSLDYCFITQIS